MKIALLGSRGIPARYSGFETFYEQLGVRLAGRGHEVTVYNRSHFIRDVKGSYRGVRLVSLPSIPTKHLDTLTHTALSALHALTQGYDIAYFSIVGNSPLAWLPRLAGARVLLNVDGEDGARAKWGRFARWYQRQCERIAAATAQVIIADARAIQDRYRERYHKDSVFVPYGANTARDEGTEALARWGLAPRDYLLYVGRLVPENAIDVLIDAYRGLPTSHPLVIVGDAPFAERYKAELRRRAGGDTRIVFTGYAFGRDYAQLSSHALLYVQPSGIDGTRPALLDQMGFGNCVVVRDTKANVEVVADAGATFSQHAPAESLRLTLADLLAEPDRMALLRPRALERIRTYYNWEWITDFHEDLFGRLVSQRTPVSYDRFLQERKKP
jgi:glycosyltransferase involved in cell wall biosynthesis